MAALSNKIEGIDYTPAGVLSARDNIVQLRDEALKQAEFQWAVLLSHVIAYLADYADGLDQKK